MPVIGENGSKKHLNIFLSGPESYRDFRETGPSGLKTGVKNGIFWSEIGLGFGEPAAHPYREFRGVPPGGHIGCFSVR